MALVRKTGRDVGYCDECEEALTSLFGAVLVCACDKYLCDGCAEEHEERWHWSWTRETDEENVRREEGQFELTFS